MAISLTHDIFICLQIQFFLTFSVHQAKWFTVYFILFFNYEVMVLVAICMPLLSKNVEHIQAKTTFLV